MIPYKKIRSFFNGLAKDTLFALNLFIIFLLLFEHRFTVPIWLQPFGRMHPLLLHFPIVMLIIGMFLEFFRFSKTNSTQQLYQSFTSNIILIGALLSGITAIMGLFLSKEEGYDPAALQWHKWSGVILFFVGSLVYLFRNAAWYSPAVSRGGAMLTVFFIISAGHFGAALTHGENYILQPLSAISVTENVALEDARVFDHMVKPILQNKCVGCHNNDKLKGGLLLTDAESIIKGGKSGDLIIPGNPGMSLLFKRIHLPEDDKKHMPPKGKPQLTDEEILLLQLWVKENAEFKKKVLEYPATDSIRLMADGQFKPLKSSEEVYEFAAADKDLIKKLNNDYRVITPLSKESPALAVDLYNRSAFKPAMLGDLLVLKNQVVDLSLSKMPVTDADLKIVGQFLNIRKLNLNFTDITGQGLKALAPLVNLKYLSVSGTNMTLTALKEQVHAFKNLQQLTVWNSGLSEADLQQLKKSNKQVTFLSGYADDGSSPIRLNSPQAVNSSFVFADSMTFALKHTIRGTEIRYTLDGSVPDSIQSLIFKNGITLKSDAIVKARAFKKGWLGSDTVTFALFKNSFSPDTTILLSKPFQQHAKRNISTLFDGVLGALDINENPGIGIDEKWIGFSPEKMEVLSVFKQPRVISSVALHIMVRTKMGIYPPTGIEIWAGENMEHMKLAGRSVHVVPNSGSDPELTTVLTAFKPVKVACLKIIATTAKKLPPDNMMKNRGPLMLFDEILIN